MIEIVQLTEADDKSLGQINDLQKQLSPGIEKCSLELLQKIVGSSDVELWTLVDEGKIIGMATLILILKPSGEGARMEDVVVDESYRGQGLGQMIVKKIVERAKARGALSFYFSSRPSRVAANKLYQKMGFELHETNTYKLKF